MLTPKAEVSMLEIPTIPTLDEKDLRFRHVEDLQSALEEYAAFHDGTIVRNYGPASPAAAGPRTGDEMAASQERIMRQNKAIDRAMRRLAIMAPLSHRLVHGYYRRPGPSGTPAACQEARGWETAARYAGLMPTRSDRSAGHLRRLLGRGHRPLVCRAPRQACLGADYASGGIVGDVIHPGMNSAAILAAASSSMAGMAWE